MPSRAPSSTAGGCDLGVIPHVLPEESVVPSLHEAVEALNRLLVTRPEETLVPKSYLFKVGG